MNRYIDIPKPKEISLAIVGSRHFSDKVLFEKSILELIVNQNINIKKIISGGAKGADSLAEKYASENRISMHIFFPDWDTYGKAAGRIRNRKIVESCDYLLAFWDGQSSGTKSSIDIAKELGKSVSIINF